MVDGICLCYLGFDPYRICGGVFTMTFENSNPLEYMEKLIEGCDGCKKTSMYKKYLCLICQGKVKTAVDMCEIVLRMDDEFNILFSELDLTIKGRILFERAREKGNEALGVKG